jgi:hypothetical protein
MQIAPGATPSAARAASCSSRVTGRESGSPLGTKATGAPRIQRRKVRSSPRDTAATPRVKLPSRRANASYPRTADVLRVSPWKVATTGTPASRPAISARKSALKSCAWRRRTPCARTALATARAQVRSNRPALSNCSARSPRRRASSASKQGAPGRAMAPTMGA